MGENSYWNDLCLHEIKLKWVLKKSLITSGLKIVVIQNDVFKFSTP